MVVKPLVIGEIASKAYFNTIIPTKGTEKTALGRPSPRVRKPQTRVVSRKNNRIIAVPTGGVGA